MTENRTSNVVALFPGQGGFDGEAIAKAAAQHPEIRAVFEEIDQVTLAETGRSLSSIVLDHEPPTLARLLADEPWVSQLAIYGTDLAVHRVLHGLGLRPDALMGHSLGEIAALVAAGVYTVTDGARIIWQRVRIVSGADLRDGYMAALSADAHRARMLVELVGGEELAVAVENHDRQTVVSGSAAAMETLRQAATAVGISFARLESPAPFHSPLLRQAGDELAAAIRGIPARAPEVPVFSPILNRWYTSHDDMPALLAIHLVEPVRFDAAVRSLHTEGARYYVECGAVGTLRKFTARALGDAPHTAVAGLPAGSEGMEQTIHTLRESEVLSDTIEGARGQEMYENRADFDAFWAARGTDIIEYIWRAFEAHRNGAGAPAPSTPAPVAPVSNGPTAPPANNGQAEASPAAVQHDVPGEMRELYADALEYPVEVFTDEVELEAELGIDSVKQIELLTRVSEKYDLELQDDGFRLADYDTMGKVIDYTMSRLASKESADV